MYFNGLKFGKIKIFAVISIAIILSAAITFPCFARDLRLGAYKYLSDSDMKKLLQPFISHLSKSINAPVKLYITSTYSELSQRIISGELDMAIMPPYAYVKLADKIHLKLLASMKLAGTYYYNGVIAVRKNAPINSLADLKGKKFAYVSKDSASGYLYPRILFEKSALNPDALFSEVIYTGSHFDSVKALACGSVDGIAVFKDSIDFAKIQGIDTAEIKVLKETEKIPHEAFVAQYNMNEELAGRIRKALFSFKYDEAELKAMTLSNKNVFKMEGWVAGIDSLYEPVREAQKMFPLIDAETIKDDTSSVTIGFYPRSDIDSTLKSFQPFLEYLKKETGLNFKLAFSPNYLDVGNQLIDGNYKLSILTPVAFIMTQNKSKIKIERLFQRAVSGKSTYCGVIICKSDAKMNSLADLKDSIFAFTEPDSISGRLYPLGIFKQNNIQLKSFFKKTYYAGCPKSALTDVLAGKADACAVTEAEFDTLISDPKEKQSLKILFRTPPIPSECWSVSSAMDTQLRTKIIKSIEKLNNDKMLKSSILDKMFYDGFYKPSEEGFSELKEVLKTIM